MTDRELAGCPLCGGPARVQSHRSCDCCGKAYTAIVACVSDECGCSVDHFDTDEEAIATWNRRTPSSEGDGRDAERYRWLRRHGELYLPGVKDAVNSLYRDDSPGMWDAAIDAAIAAAAGVKES